MDEAFSSADASGRGEGFVYLHEPGAGEGLVERDGSRAIVRLAPGEATDLEEGFLLQLVVATVHRLRGDHCLHASAVVAGDEVVAFAGPSGSGKSTLAAFCAASGLALYADDLLFCEVRGEEATAVGGYQLLHLLPDALEALGHDAARFAPVVPGVEKRRVRPEAIGVRAESRRLPLRTLHYLDPDFGGSGGESVSGAEKVKLLRESLFTIDAIGEGEQGETALFRAAADLGRAVSVRRWPAPETVEDLEAACRLLGIHSREEA